MKKIVIESGDDFNLNIGDESYFAAMVSLFREYLDDVQIIKFSHSPEKTMQRYGVKAVYSGESFLKQLRSLPTTLKTIKECDLYILGGGQIICDPTVLLAIIRRLTRSFLAKQLFQKPVMSYALGVGPLNRKISRLLTRYVLNKFDVITVRDIASKELLKEIGVKKTIFITPDPALALVPVDVDRVKQIFVREGLNIEGTLVAIAPYGPAFHRKLSIFSAKYQVKHDIWPKGGKEKYENYTTEMAKTCDYIIDKYNASIIFVSMDASKWHGGDDKIGTEITSKMINEEHAKVIGTQYSPSEMTGILSKMSLVIGSRLHSVILATLVNVPVIGIIFEQKTKSFMELIGQGKYIMGADKINTEDLIPIVDSVWQNKEQIKKYLEIKLKELEKDVRSNVTFVAKLLSIREKKQQF